MRTPKRNAKMDPQPGDVLEMGGDIVTIDKREIAQSRICHIQTGTDYIAYSLHSRRGAIFYMSIWQLQKSRKVAKVIHAAD